MILKCLDYCYRKHTYTSTLYRTCTLHHQQEQIRMIHNSRKRGCICVCYTVTGCIQLYSSHDPMGLTPPRLSGISIIFLGDAPLGAWGDFLGAISVSRLCFVLFYLLFFFLSLIQNPLVVPLIGLLFCCCLCKCVGVSG